MPHLPNLVVTDRFQAKQTQVEEAEIVLALWAACWDTQGRDVNNACNTPTSIATQEDILQAIVCNLQDRSVRGSACSARRSLSRGLCWVLSAINEEAATAEQKTNAWLAEWPRKLV